jgi:hypothetical protein
MRKTLIIFFLAVITLVGAYSCKKGEVYGSFESMTVGAYVKLVKQGNSILDFGNLNTTAADITVVGFGSDIEKVKIYASVGSRTFDKTKWKAVKEVPLSGETQLSVKATELASALGIAPTSLTPGTAYTFYNQLYLKDGRVFDPANTNSAYQGLPDYQMAMTWNAILVCPFSPTGFPGNFLVQEDGWADYGPGDIVQVSAASATSMTMNVYPNPAYPGAVGPGGGPAPGATVVTIVPATGAATVAAQSYGGYDGFDTDIKVKTVGTSNWVFSCTGTVTLKLNHTGFGNWGDYTIRLKKL